MATRTRDAVWERRQASFNEAPEVYAQHRPGYPEAALAEIVHFAGVRPGDAVLEIGCGPGQVTLPMARRGLRVHAVEFGDQMAQLVQARAAQEGLEVRVDVGRFEDWIPPTPGFPLVYAAASFHWLDPLNRMHLAAQALAPGGALALLWNRHVRIPADRGFFDAIQPDYVQAGMVTRSEPLPTMDQLPVPYAEEIAGSGHYSPVTVHRYPGEWHLTPEAFAALLDTYSDHRILDSEVKARLFGAITERAHRDFEGRIVRGTCTVLYLARRLN